MSTVQTSLDERAATARSWALEHLALRDCEFAPASADASFRRYFRLAAQGQSWILMDAPPAQENSRPFINIAQRLAQAGLHVPRVLHADLGQGFLLLTDLGRKTYLHTLTPENADELFDDAIGALVQMQSKCSVEGLPAYDDALLRRELALFPDWYVTRHLQRDLSAAQRQAWNAICDRLIDSALDQPKVFVHRDYMPRNLMRSDPNPGVLDFQDAVRGPITYDAVCLFKDAFLSWPEQRVEGWLAAYAQRATAAGLDLPRDFQRALDWMGVQRHLKVMGIFARICYRDGKPHYLEDAPRFARYLRDVIGRYAELAPLGRLIDELERDS